ncbi:MAG: efflux RND transporter periplasmic adaptor subunit, partial [Armatimonadetes bacterium]|nr:efflux RND transporter periplasmic adaptor subunit [Armatimonadota bacterium]
AEKAALASTRARRSDTVLIAPTDGYVSERLADPGSMATPGQPILALQFFREIWVNVPVPEQISTRVRPGDVLTVTLDALPGQTLRAAVIKVNPSADPQARQFTVRGTLDNSQGLLKPGMYAHVDFVTERVSGLAVPREAVQEDEQGAFVYVVDAAKKAYRRSIKPGLADATHVAITEGLKPGDQVVTVCPRPLKDGEGVALPGENGGGRGGGRGEGQAPPGADKTGPTPAGTPPAAPAPGGAALPAGRRPQ